MPEFKLLIGQRDTNTGDVLWSVIRSSNLSLSVSKWEAIRVYMEEGMVSLPPYQSDEFEEGTVTYFHMRPKGYLSRCNRQVHFHHHKTAKKIAAQSCDFSFSTV